MGFAGLFYQRIFFKANQNHWRIHNLEAQNKKDTWNVRNQSRSKVAFGLNANFLLKLQ